MVTQTGKRLKIDGTEVKPSELEGAHVHELYDPRRVHQLNTSNRPVEMQA